MQTSKKNKNEPLFEFKKLEVYKRSEEFADRIFNVTDDFPTRKYSSLIYQITKSALSVSLNLAEGFGNHYKNQKKRYFRIARGSVFECIPALKTSFNQKLIEEDKFKELYEECYHISRMISGLINSVDNRSEKKKSNAN